MEGISNISDVQSGYQSSASYKTQPVKQAAGASDAETEKMIAVDGQNVSSQKAVNQNGMTSQNLAGGSSGDEKGKEPISDQDRDKALNILKSQLKNTKLQISYNDDVNRFSIAVLDGQTDKVIKEIPSEDALKLLEHNMELAGMLVDEKR